MTHFSGFHKKTRLERLALLKQNLDLSGHTFKTLVEDSNLPETVAGQMTENHIGTFSLPMSVVPEMRVDDKTVAVPLVTEEPSVVAALNYASKIIGKSGGFTTTITNRLMIGQVALYDIPDRQQAIQSIQQAEDAILSLANTSHPSIVKRGGGARSLRLEIKEPFLIVYLTADVKEAMGANMLNNMLEGIKPLLQELTNAQALMAILSNYAMESLVTTTCTIPFTAIPGGKSSAEKIALASKLAQVDPYRAATHNKGIFNGIDAIILATGNDWRAIEAGAHAYASRDGQYRGLSVWTIEEDQLVGTLTLPMPVATVGGSIGLNPKVSAAFELLGHPDAKTLAGLVVSIGLAQNFAALRALVTTGIQEGHMKLQAKSLALLAGATEEEVETVTQLLRQAPHANLEQAQTILSNLRKC